MSPNASPVGAQALPLRVLLLRRANDFVHAAETIAKVAEGEGYRVVGVHPLTQSIGRSDQDSQIEAVQQDPEASMDAPVPPALVIELDSPELIAAFLRTRPEAAALLPIRVLLVQQGSLIRASTIEPSAYRELFDRPSTQLQNRLSWLEVTLDVVLRYLA